jgi:hypothetical protein
MPKPERKANNTEREKRCPGVDDVPVVVQHPARSKCWVFPEYHNYQLATLAADQWKDKS